LLHIPAEPLRIMTPEMKKRQAGSRELIIAGCPIYTGLLLTLNSWKEAFLFG
jgi:hypothetical protein